jgi:glycolate dehydrogenase FAD-binding subunit
MRPQTADEAVSALRECVTADEPVRPVGTGSRADWGGPDPREITAIETAGLNRVLAHDVGDFTAVLQAGVPLAQAQAEFAHSGQWLAVDPPPHPSAGAGTIGGLVATADSGPCRHRYGGVRDLVIGLTVALSDGTLARSGGKVIKNVAGYDLAKLLTGSYGTLGLIVEVVVRLHPVPPTTATVVAEDSDAARLVSTALGFVRTAGDVSCLDLAWADGAGRLLIRFAGHAALDRAKDTATQLSGVRVVDDDDPLWADHRAAQRGELVVKVSGRPTDLSTVVGVVERHGGRLVARVAGGLSWLNLPAGTDVAAIRGGLAPRACTVLDGAGTVAGGRAWPTVAPAALGLMSRVKERFDPAGLFRPGAFVGGI